MIKSILSNNSTKLYIVLGGFFVANAIIAEFMGVKIFSLEGTLGVADANIPLFGKPFSFNLTAGVLLWPVVFVMTDIINEYYGIKGVKFLSYISVVMISYGFLMFYGAIKLAPATFWQQPNYYPGVANANVAFGALFGQGLWIIIGSLAAFLVGQVLDVYAFQKIKQLTGEKYIWLRSTGSTLISQLVDSFIVLFIAFYIGPRVSGGTAWSIRDVLSIGGGNYIYKFIMALALTPVIYLVHAGIERYLGHTTAKQMKDGALLNA